MENEKRIIEVNGIKMEVDMRHAKIVEEYKVGDNVKMLMKEYNSYKSYPAVIAGFDAFEKLPTITLAYLDVDYNSAKIKFAYFNESSQDIEIVPMPEYERLINKRETLDMLDNEIRKKEEEVGELQRKKVFFVERFGKYFEGQGINEPA